MIEAEIAELTKFLKKKKKTFTPERVTNCEVMIDNLNNGVKSLDSYIYEDCPVTWQEYMLETGLWMWVHSLREYMNKTFKPINLQKP